jgi:flagellar basal-body rod protein FlgC
MSAVEASAMSLVNAMGNALSGMNAAAAQMTMAASNVANMDSRGYKAGRVNLAENAEGGVRVDSVTTDPSPGEIDDQGQEGSNVDPAQEVVGMMLARFSYAANAKVVNTVDQMMGTMLDAKG